MERFKYNLGTTLGLGRARLLSAERVVNLFAEAAPANAETPIVLRGVSGLASFASAVGNGPIRGLHEMDGVLFVVSGEDLYTVGTDGAATRVAGLPGAGAVLIADNGLQLLIQRTDETSKAYLATASSVTQITDADFPGAVSVAFLDGYFIGVRPNSGQVFASTVYDGSSWDALDFATAESNPDLTVAVASLGAYLVLFGQESLELWFAAGGTAFPFARASGGRLDRGCAAARSVQRVGNLLLWLGDDGAVYSLMGSQLQRVSTPAVEAAIAAAGNKADATAVAWEEQGHPFYALTLAAGTFVYDAATQFWHERASFGRTNWRVGHICRAHGYTLAAEDGGSSALWKLDPGTYSEAGEELRREVTAAPIENARARVFIRSVELSAEVGVGLTAGGSTYATQTITFTGVPANPTALAVSGVNIPTLGDGSFGATAEQVATNFTTSMSGGLLVFGQWASLSRLGAVVTVTSILPGSGVADYGSAAPGMSVPSGSYPTGNFIELIKSGDAGSAITLGGTTLTGGATTVVQGSDPQVCLQWSDDGGATWSNELWRSLGKRGERKQRVIWKRLGAGRRRSFRIAISDPIPVTLFGLVVEAETGNE